MYMTEQNPSLPLYMNAQDLKNCMRQNTLIIVEDHATEGTYVVLLCIFLDLSKMSLFLD